MPVCSLIGAARYRAWPHGTATAWPVFEPRIRQAVRRRWGSGVARTAPARRTHPKCYVTAACRTPVRLLAFAGARDVLGAGGARRSPLDAPCTAAELLAEVCRHISRARALAGSIRVAVNGTYARPDNQVRGGDEVALIPPVAGG